MLQTTTLEAESITFNKNSKMKIDFTYAKSCDVVIKVFSDCYTFDVIGEPDLVTTVFEAMKGSRMALNRMSSEHGEQHREQRLRVTVPTNYDRHLVVLIVVKFLESQNLSVQVK